MSAPLLAAKSGLVGSLVPGVTTTGVDISAGGGLAVPTTAAPTAAGTGGGGHGAGGGGAAAPASSGMVAAVGETGEMPLEEPPAEKLPADPMIAPTIGQVVNGTSGNDVIIGTDQADSISGGDGDDVIYGRDGDDDLAGDAGDDQLYGEGGDDTLDGGSGNDLVDGGSGNDVVDGGTGDDIVTGGTGSDTVSGGNPSGPAVPDAGGDTSTGGSDEDVAAGGGSSGTPGDSPTLPDPVGSGDDILDGGPDNDNDILSGWDGDDTYILRSMRDLLQDDANIVDSRLSGNDTVVVASDYRAHTLADPDARLLAPDGLVTFRLGTALDAPPAGANGYVQQIHPDIENVRLEGGDAHDVMGSEDANRLTGNSADNLLFGRGGDDILFGAEGNDLLAGGAGMDSLSGGDGQDTLYGDAGNDILDGGAGEDLLYGGAGDDTFVLGLSDGAVDTVFDHEGNDTIRLEGADPSKIKVAFGQDGLELSHDGQLVAVLANDQQGNMTTVSSIDTGQGAQSIFDFLSFGTMQASAGSGDLLASELAQGSPPPLATSDILVVGADELAAAGQRSTSAPSGLSAAPASESATAGSGTPPGSVGFDPGGAAGFAFTHDLWQPPEAEAALAAADADRLAEQLHQQQG